MDAMSAVDTSGAGYYLDTAGEVPVSPVLHGSVDASVCIVGGGFAGLNTALGLSETEQARLYHGTALEWLGLPRTRFE